MLCPYCLHTETKVVDKRDTDDTIKRRRECLKCTKRFTTREGTEKLDIRIVKKDGRREDFNREKIRRGITRACEKRSVSTDQIEKMIYTIEGKLMRKGPEVKTNLIGQLITNELKKIDKVAYIRFASVYKEFADLSDFKKEIKEIIKK